MIQVRAQSRHLRIQVIVSVLKTNFSFSMKVMYAPLCLEGSGLYFSEGRLKDSTHFIKYLKMTSEDFFCSFFFFFCSFFHSRLKFFVGFCRLLWNLPTLEILDDTEGIESMETRKVLSLVSDVKEPKTQSANVALFRVICARVDGYLRHQLQEIQVSTGKEDGYAALLLLRDLFADASDMDYQVYALNIFKTVTLKTNKSIFDFNKRFGLLYWNVVSSGVFLPEKDRIWYYLRALRQHKDAQILFEVKALTRDFQSGSERSLREIQRLLIKEEDIVTGNQYTMPMEATPRETSKFFKYSKHWKSSKKPRSKNYAAAAGGSRKKYSTPFQGVCYGCNKTGHTLYECPLTSQEDKKKIYELKRTARSSERVKQHRSDVTQAHNSEAKPTCKEGSRKEGNHF